MVAVIESVAVGTLKALKDSGALSGIDKRPVAGPWHIGTLGIEGDFQGDLKRHGGSEKAVHQYPIEHYAAWRVEEPELGPMLAHTSAFGENLTTTGMTERSVCIGDVYRLGNVVLQVSQGRQPCWKLNHRFSRPDMALRVQQTGRTGWYYRVLQPGFVTSGDHMELVDRPQPGWPLTRLIADLFEGCLDPAELWAMAQLKELSESWRDLAGWRLRLKAVEDWKERLGSNERRG